jgi:hypothetical protein
MQLIFVHAPGRGSGHKKRYKPCNAAVRKIIKKSVITIKNKDQLLCLVHSLIGLLQVVVGNAHVYLESWAKNRLIWNLTVVPNWFHNFTTQKEDRMKSKLPHRHLPAPSRFGAHWWHSPSNARTASALGKTFSPKPASTPR